MRSTSESGASEAARQRKEAQEEAAGRGDLLVALAGCALMCLLCG